MTISFTSVYQEFFLTRECFARKNKQTNKQIINRRDPLSILCLAGEKNSVFTAVVSRQRTEIGKDHEKGYGG